MPWWPASGGPSAETHTRERRSCQGLLDLRRLLAGGPQQVGQQVDRRAAIDLFAVRGRPRITGVLSAGPESSAVRPSVRRASSSSPVERAHPAPPSSPAHHPGTAKLPDHRPATR